jgi:osmoprotectant transport system ATP-binding protein
MADTMISLRDVTKRFPGAARPAVDRLSLDIEEGQTVVLVGPSGCGKTTTMKMINRLIEPSGGTIEVDGTDVMRQDPVRLRRRIGYVIQSIGLLPHRTVAQNIATVPTLEGWDRARTDARVRELTGMLQLDEELLPRYPAELSGGQRQRVGVARALAADPPVMLMDEPFAAVDPIVRARLQDQLVGLQRRLRKTIVFVTHDIDEAIVLADRIAILNIGGILEQYGPPEEILRAPANPFVEDFVGPERGLKRLALITVSDIEVEEGPVVGPATPAEDARRMMKETGFGWVAVIEDRVIRGWVDGPMLEGRDRVKDASPRKFGAYLTPVDSLRKALDSIVASRTNVAVVADQNDRYLGILTLERISREIRVPS